MADADYFLNLSSSPDPLADDVPTPAVRSVSRRTTKSQYDLSSAANPLSSPQRRGRQSSPRKRTFKLNVGDGQSPHRIRVTVEAEDGENRDDVSRNLFPPASPTRKARRRETITTTTVPLNDEPTTAGAGTPRRPRRRRVSNGTPMPRKRAGTPLARESKHQRLDDDDVLSSEVANLDDAPADIGDNYEEETPKPRTRQRKTPIKPPASASKKTGSATGKKRGRPRKVQISSEPDIPETITENPVDASAETDLNPNEGQVSSNVETDEVSSGRIQDTTARGTFKAPPRRRSDITSIVKQRYLEETTQINMSSSRPSSSYEDLPENHVSRTHESYHGREPTSELRSEETDDMSRHDGQDTIADASDFSMIAVDSLPSFQASFHESFHGNAVMPSSDQRSMGEETSRIINDTIESLRRSLQSEKDRHSHAAETEGDSRRSESRNENRSELLNQSTMSTNYNGERASSRSPASLKPLNRQVLVGRGNIDDSFSMMPDSILHAATPGRLPMKPTATEQDHHDSQLGVYDTSFSTLHGDEEAATPVPPEPLERSSRRSPAKQQRLLGGAHSARRLSSSNYGSGRLPTPDETSSSNAGSKKMHGEDAEASPELRENTDSPHRAELPSSPPIQTRPRALDYGPSDLQRELSGAQEKHLSSPKQQPSNKASSNPIQSLEVPLPIVRPSLSPIVRVGRTLQNVMSDNSSPENREPSLRSPFQGPRSSVPRSPSPSIRNRPAANKAQPTAESPIRLDRTLYPKLDNPSEKPSQTAEVEAPSVLGRSRPPRESRWASRRQRSNDPVPSVENVSMTSSTRANPSIDQERSWAEDLNGSQILSGRETTSQTTSTRDQRTESRGASANKMADTHETEVHSEQDNGQPNEEIRESEDDGEEEENNNAYYDDDDDELDVWDIEASRTSPLREEEPADPAPPSKTELPSAPRRSTVPSPWRRNTRRLIFKDNIASSTQIEIEESPPSEPEDQPPVKPRQRPAPRPPVSKPPAPLPPASQPSTLQPPASQSPATQPAATLPVAPQPSASRPSVSQQPTAQQPISPQPPSQTSASQRLPSLPSVSQPPASQSFVSPPQQDTRMQSPDPAPVQESPVQKEMPPRMTSASPQYSDDVFVDHAGLADHDESDNDDLAQDEGLEASQEPQDSQLTEDEQLERDTQKELEDFYQPQAREAEDEEVSEYPLPAQKPQQTPKDQEKTAAPKSKFFGALDLLNFFSSPANLPTLKTYGSKPPAPVEKPALATQQPKEPPKGIWSTGLFPTLPLSASRRSSVEQVSNSPSTDPAAHSSDTVADTYEASPSVSPTPARSSAPAEPSTPERQVYPPIQQKRDVTPRQGESRGAPSGTRQAGTSNAQEKVGDGSNSGYTGSSDDQDSSGLTEGSEYERVPPRDKPSQWDRHLSPTKSCFRSPLKPTPQGRVVAFSNNALFPQAAQAQTRNVLQTGNNNIVSQGPFLQPSFDGKENQPPADTQQLRSTLVNNNQNESSSSSNGAAPKSGLNILRPSQQQQQQPNARSFASLARSTLSQTTWSDRHWRRLYTLFQLRRDEPHRFTRDCVLPSPERRRSRALLGTSILSHDVRIVLEEWHLDVIEAFRFEVGAWDERVLAKKVFALVANTERRRARVEAVRARVAAR